MVFDPHGRDRCHEPVSAQHPREGVGVVPFPLIQHLLLQAADKIHDFFAAKIKSGRVDSLFFF